MKIEKRDYPNNPLDWKSVQKLMCFQLKCLDFNIGEHNSLDIIMNG